MRVAIFDGILEEHVGSSLERALRMRGHSVLNTGRFGSGFRFSGDAESTFRAEKMADLVSEFTPDLILVFRPASANALILEKLKSTGATVAAWLSDDPVLWNLSYQEFAKEYDILLHCGDSDVIGFYEKKTGHQNGVYFPFWTDSEAFPYSYVSKPLDSDVVFLGQTTGEVKRHRYHELARLRHSTKIHGKTGVDYAFLSGGYLDSDEEVVDSCARSLVGVNFPQYFEQYRGTEAWFKELENFSFFPYPSRVVQYAALGLPIISVVPDERKLRHFPEIICVEKSSMIDDIIDELIHADELRDLSQRTHRRFLRSFSAQSRVLMLEHLIADSSWRQLSIEERAGLFTQFPGDTVQPSSDSLAEQGQPARVDISATMLAPKTSSNQRVGIINVTPNRSTVSTEGILRRELTDLGIPCIDLSDPRSVETFTSHEVDDSTVIVIAADAIEPQVLDKLRMKSPDDVKRIIFFTSDRLKLASNSQADIEVLSQATVVVRSVGAKRDCIDSGLVENQIMVHPCLVDTPYLRAMVRNLHGTEPETGSLLVLSGAKDSFGAAVSRDIELLGDLVNTLDIEDLNDLPTFLRNLATARAVVVAPSVIGGDEKVPEWIGLVAASGKPVFYPRRPISDLPFPPGKAFQLVEESGELIRKLSRIDSSYDVEIAQTLVNHPRWKELFSSRYLLKSLLDGGFSDGAIVADQMEGFSEGPNRSTNIDLSRLPHASALMAAQWFGNPRPLRVDLTLSALELTGRLQGVITIESANSRRQRIRIDGRELMVSFILDWDRIMPAVSLEGVVPAELYARVSFSKVPTMFPKGTVAIGRGTTRNESVRRDWPSASLIGPERDRVEGKGIVVAISRWGEWMRDLIEKVTPPKRRNDGLA